MYRSILVPLDGSPFSEHALPVALGIAKQAGAAVRLLHVHVPLLYTTGLSAVDSGGDASVKSQEREYLDDTVARWQAAAPGVRMSSDLLVGYAPDVLREQMHGDADLMVMTTHGRGLASRFWLGSVTDAMMRTAAIPLLVLRPSEQPTPVSLAPLFDHIMVPLDGSNLAELALEPALQLGQLMESQITLLRVVKPIGMLDANGGGPEMTDLNEPLTRQAVNEAQGYLNQVAERLHGRGLNVQTRAVLFSSPVDGILETTKEEKADVIALATHGLGGLRRLLLGSVADKVLRGGTTPMLICRPHRET